MQAPELRTLALHALSRVPSIEAGQPLLPVLLAALDGDRLTLQPGDVVVLAQKIVSKSERRYRALADVVPGERARRLAVRCGKDPRFVQAVLDESTAVLRCVPGTLIVRHRLGPTMANAGIDQSNLPAAAEDRVLLLPEDPDRSAAALRDGLHRALGVDVGVVISDSFGRPWRLGTTGVCIGCAGLVPLHDRRSEPDLFGRPLQVTQSAVGDAVAAAAVLLMGEGAEGRPIVIVRGLPADRGDAPARTLVRPPRQDLFR